MKSVIYALIILLYCSHIPFDSSGIRVDIYPFYDYPEPGRLLANVLWESSMYIIAWLFLFLAWKKDRDKAELIFLIWWTYNILGYFLFFGQGTNLIGILLLIILIIFIYGKQKFSSSANRGVTSRDNRCNGHS